MTPNIPPNGKSMTDIVGQLPEADVWASLHRLMLQPTGRYDAKLRGIELPNYQRIVEVIGPFRSAAGVLLNSIRIQLNTLGTPGSLALAPDIRQEFSSRMRQLKNFTFCSSYAEDAEDADDLNNFLFACLDTSSLKKLWLKLNGRAQNQAKANLGKIIGSRSRHELTNIYLSGVAIDLSTLVLFLELLPESLSSLGIQLWDVHLLSGTWKEVLDALRKKKSCVMVLRQPRGAECAGMSQKNYRRIFDSNNREPITEFNHGPPSMAEVYIANWCSPALNPLQALEDGFDIPTAN